MSGGPAPEEKAAAPTEYIPGTNQTREPKVGDLWWYAYQKALAQGWILGEPDSQAFPSPGPWGWKTPFRDIDGNLGPANGSWEFSDHGWCLWEGTAAGIEDDIVYDPTFGVKTTAAEWAGKTAGEAHIRKLFSHYGKLHDIEIGYEPALLPDGTVDGNWRKLVPGKRTLDTWISKTAFPNGRIRIVGKRYDESEVGPDVIGWERVYPPWE